MSQKKIDKEKLKQSQVFTPPLVTNEMLDLLDQQNFSDTDTFFLEPTCGDGQMLIVIVERIYKSLLAKYEGDTERALSEALFRFYAAELDDTLVPTARNRVFQFAAETIGRELNRFEQHLISWQLWQSIECRDFFTETIPALDTSPGMREIQRKILKMRERNARQLEGKNGT